MNRLRLIRYARSVFFNAPSLPQAEQLPCG
jgi:hypothetical protein